jgi:LytS/YehU family sensor histidine kinase
MLGGPAIGLIVGLFGGLLGVFVIGLTTAALHLDKSGAKEEGFSCFTTTALLKLNNRRV